MENEALIAALKRLTSTTDECVDGPALHNAIAILEGLSMDNRQAIKAIRKAASNWQQLLKHNLENMELDESQKLGLQFDIDELEEAFKKTKR